MNWQAPLGTTICGQCFALVPEHLAAAHLHWHNGEFARHQNSYRALWQQDITAALQEHDDLKLTKMRDEAEMAKDLEDIRQMTERPRPRVLRRPSIAKETEDD